MLAAKPLLHAAGTSPTAVPLAEEHSTDRVPNPTSVRIVPTASVVVVVVVDDDAKRKRFPKFLFLLLALPYPVLAFSSLAAARLIDRVRIAPICVARNAISGLDIAGGLGGGGCMEFSELEEEFMLLAGSCSCFF